MNRTCLAAALLVAAACSSQSGRLRLPALPGDAGIVVRVRVEEAGNAVRRVPIEEYVVGSILSEVAPPAGEAAVLPRMYEVQAIVARTYALANRGRHAREGYDLCSTTHCQLYQPSRLATSRWASIARAAASRTAGSALWHGPSPAGALFHADCGGHTSAAADVWGGTPRPYLAATRDDDVEGAVHAAWRYEVAAADLLRALNADARTRVGKRLDTLRVVDRDVAGRADTVAIHGERERLVRGAELRALLTRALGAGTVRSTLFTVRRERTHVVFEGRGFGHGVGLCQAGALARLRAGASPASVLQRYFPHTTVRRLGD